MFHESHVLHTQVPEEAGLLAQLPQNFVVDFLDLVEYFLLLDNVTESVGLQVLEVHRLVCLEFVVDLGFVFFLDEGVHAVPACDES